jgi:hypothetical protein
MNVKPGIGRVFDKQMGIRFYLFHIEGEFQR